MNSLKDFKILLYDTGVLLTGIDTLSHCESIKPTSFQCPPIYTVKNECFKTTRGADDLKCNTQL